MTDYLAWIYGMVAGSTGYALAYALEAFCVAWAARKGWDMAKKR